MNGFLYGDDLAKTTKNIFGKSGSFLSIDGIWESSGQPPF